MPTPVDGPLRVLLCDDDLELSGALAILIGYNGEMVLAAAPVRTGRGAIDAVELHHPDVVLMDVNLLGRLNGYEATAVIRERSPGTNVVILSGVANSSQASVDAHQAGAFAFLPKTCPPAAILDAIKAAGQATRQRGTVKQG